MKKLLLVLSLGAVFSAVPTAAFDPSMQTSQEPRKYAVPTEQVLTNYRERVSRWKIKSKRDADRVEYVMALISYAKATIDGSSRLARQYYLVQLQDVVSRHKAQRGAKKPLLQAPAKFAPNEEPRRPGPSADPVCYHEGVEDECATDEEMAETDAFADASAYELQQHQAYIEEAMMLMSGLDAACSEAATSGPSPEEQQNCAGQAWDATMAAGANAAAILGWQGAKADAAAQGLRMAKKSRWSWHILLVSTAVAVGYYTGSLATCIGGGAPVPETLWALPEPMYSLR